MRPQRDNTPVRMKDPTTGGEKEMKPARHDLVPAEVQDEMARVYGMGAQKYEPHNYLHGYPWSWSIRAALSHFHAWQMGEDYDPESGLHHLAHAAWHMNALMMFQWHELGSDDRLQPNLEQGTLFE
jgi:hypothetical protein